MAAGTRRYQIELIVNTQQLTQAGQAANQVQQQVQQGASGVAGAIQNATNSVARYVIGIQGIRMAWSFASQEMQRYMDMKQRMDEQTRTDAQKAADHLRNQRQYLRNQGAFTDPTKRQAALQVADTFAKDTGFSDSESMEFLTKWSSDVSQYIGNQGEKGRMNLINRDQGAWLMKMIGLSSRASGVSPENATKLAGSILGSRNWNQYGERAGANALSEYEGVSEILFQGKGDINLNIRNFSRAANELLDIDQQQGRVTGPDRLRKVAMMIRATSEYNPEESAVFLRNWVEGLRAFGKKSTATEWKKAGVEYGDPLEQTNKVMDYYEAMSRAGKLKPGETISDFIRNDAKIQVRGAAGGHAIIMGQKKGLFAAAEESASTISPDTVEGMVKGFAAADPSMRLDSAQAAREAARIRQGTPKIGVETARQKTLELFAEQGWWTVNDPRRLGDRGFFRKWNPYNWGGGDWKDTADESASADLELYKFLVARNHAPGNAVGGRVMKASGLADEFYSSNPDERTRRLAEEINLYEKNGQKVVDLLEELIKIQKQANDQQKGGVPAHGQQGGMVKP